MPFSLVSLDTTVSRTSHYVSNYVSAADEESSFRKVIYLIVDRNCAFRILARVGTRGVHK